MRSHALTAAILVAGTLAAAQAAEAATISYDAAGALVFTGGSENNDQVVFPSGDDKGAGVVLAFGAAEVGAYPSRAAAADQGCYLDEFDPNFLECTFSPQAGVRFVGGGGDDKLFISLEQSASPVPVAMSGDDGADELKVGDKVLGTLDGGPGSDKVYGDHVAAAADRLLGGSGNDDLRGYGGADELRGGEGDDRFQGLSDTSPDIGDGSADVVDGGPGLDSLGLFAASPVTITQDGAADDGPPGENENVTGVEAIVSYSSGTFHGTPGNDDIYASVNRGVGPSTVYGHGGNDVLRGRDEKETLDGGLGDDTLSGGYGDDTLIGGPGRDDLKPDAGENFCVSPNACIAPTGNDRVEARDGEVDSIDCGPGADVVVADPIDTIAASCETVDRGPGSPGGPAGPGGPVTTGPGGPGDPGTSGVFDASAFVIRGRPTLRQLAKRGLSFEVGCRAACEIAARLALDRRSAKRLGLPSTTLGRASGRLAAAGKARLQIKPARKAAGRLPRLRKATVTLTVVVRDAAGKSTTASKTLALRR